MKSPFPGMDPFLERHWLDVHARLVTYAADQLNERLPASLVASTEERIAIDSTGMSDELLEAAPDVRVVEPRASDQAASGIAYHAPLKLLVELDPVKEHFIQIIQSNGERLIAVIEIISPTNKLGAGLEQFRLKREELVKAGVHVVEIDLVRRGDWRALLRPHVCPNNKISEYRVTVRLGGEPQATYLYPAALRDPLPTILIPLRRNDPQAKLDLQLLVDQVYAKGRYAERLDYQRPLSPPLSSEDMAWMTQLLKDAPNR